MVIKINALTGARCGYELLGEEGRRQAPCKT